MRLLRALAWVVAVISLAASAHVVSAFVRPSGGADRVRAQVRWLNDARADGAADRMQRLFPEGAFFTHVLTGLAAASTGDAATVAATLDDSGTDAVKAVFGDIPALDGGTFYRGWRLVLFAEHVRLGGADRGALAAEADAVQRALAASATGVPPSYPNGYWPCDAVVAMAGVLRARQVAGQRPDEAMLAEWRSRIGTVRDPASGLLAHRISATGTVVEGPRGSSQALIQTFWPDVDPRGAAGEWARFVDGFVVREAGLVGVREHPRGDDSPGDVDSGPLVFGVSASASAVTLGAARRNGATTLADDLDREAEYLGLPLEWAGTRRFAFGLLPVGDAFVAWARAVPASTTPATVATPRPFWWAHALALLLPGLAAGTWLVASRRKPPA